MVLAVVGITLLGTAIVGDLIEGCWKHRTEPRRQHDRDAAVNDEPGLPTVINS
jgi:hypothetical protein